MHATLSIGDEVVVDWRGRMGSGALGRAITRSARRWNPTPPSWAGLTKRRRR